MTQRTRSTKKPQPIITAFLKNVSGELFEQRKDIIQQMIQGQQGVYVMYARRELYYVGKAKNLKSRMKAHLRDHHAGKWDLFSVFLVRDAAHVGELEALFLHIVHPDGNAKSQRLPMADNLNDELIRRVKERVRGELKGLSLSAKALPGHGGVSSKASDRKASQAKPKAKARSQSRGIPIFRVYKGVRYEALYLGNGQVKYKGNVYDSPSGAALALTGHHANGWAWWRCVKAGKEVPLREVR